MQIMKRLTETQGGESLISLQSNIMRSVIRSIIKRHHDKTEATPSPSSSAPPLITPSLTASPTLSGQLDAQRIILEKQLYHTLSSQRSPLANLFCTFKDARHTEQITPQHNENVLSTAPTSFMASTTSASQSSGDAQLLPTVHTSHFATGVGEPAAAASDVTTAPACSTTASTKDEVANLSRVAAAVEHVHPPAQATSLTDHASSPSLPPQLQSARRGEATIHHEPERRDAVLHACGSTKQADAPLDRRGSSSPDYWLILKASAFVLNHYKDPVTGSSPHELYFYGQRAASTSLSIPTPSSDTAAAVPPPRLATVSTGTQAVAEAQASPTTAAGAVSSSCTPTQELSLDVDGPAVAADALATSAISTTASDAVAVILPSREAPSSESAQAVAEAQASPTTASSAGPLSCPLAPEPSLVVDGPAVTADALATSAISTPSSDVVAVISPPREAPSFESGQAVAEAQTSPAAASGAEFSSCSLAPEPSPVVDGPAVTADALDNRMGRITSDDAATGRQELGQGHDLRHLGRGRGSGRGGALSAVTRRGLTSPSSSTLPPCPVPASLLYHESLHVAKSPGRGKGVFGPPLPPATVLGMYTGRVYDSKAYFKLSAKSRSYGAMLSPDSSHYVVGKRGHDFLCHLNEPNEGEHANCYFVSFAVGMAEQGSPHDDLHMLWVVSADVGAGPLIEYTISYGKDYSVVRLDPQGVPYMAGLPPLGMGPTPKQLLSLIMAFCEGKGLTLRDAAYSYGMPEAKHNEELAKEARSINAAAIKLPPPSSTSSAALTATTSSETSSSTTPMPSIIAVAGAHGDSKAVDDDGCNADGDAKGSAGDKGDCNAVGDGSAVADGGCNAVGDGDGNAGCKGDDNDTKSSGRKGKGNKKVSFKDTDDSGRNISGGSGGKGDGEEEGIKGGGGKSSPADPRKAPSSKLTPSQVATAAVKRCGLNYGCAVSWPVALAQSCFDAPRPNLNSLRRDASEVGILRDAEPYGDKILCTVEHSRAGGEGWLLSTTCSPGNFQRYNVIYISLEHLSLLRDEPRPPMPRFGFGTCIGSLGTACGAIAACTLCQDLTVATTGTSLQEWLDGVVWWASELCRSLPSDSLADMRTACDELRRALASYTIGPRRSVEYVRSTMGLLLDVVTGGAIEYLQKLNESELSMPAVKAFHALVRDLGKLSLDEYIIHFQSGYDDDNDGHVDAVKRPDICRSFDYAWRAAHKAIVSGDRSRAGDAVRYSVSFSLLPMAASLSLLLHAAAALDELLPDEPAPRQGTTHYHAPSPSSGRCIYSFKQVATARWFQHAYRGSRQNLQQLLAEGVHPLVRGRPSWHYAAVKGEHLTPPLPPRRASGIAVRTSLSPELRQRRWDFYFRKPPSLTWFSPLSDEAIELLKVGSQGLVGWSRPVNVACPATLRHVLPPCRSTRNMQCGYGKHLVDEPTFAAVREERNRVLHVGAFLSKLFEALTGSKPRVVVGGGGAGGVNHGVERLGGEHCNIDIAYQPSFIKAFGDARFRLGDAVDPSIYEPELQVPGTIGMYFTLDCQLYSTINKAAMRSGKGDTSHQRLIPDAGHIAQQLLPRGFETVCESARGASVAMQQAFPHVCHQFGSDHGIRTNRPRVHGSTSPIETLTRSDLTKRLHHGMCNGTWRRMPALDQFGRSIKEPCCRGNTIPIHGTTQPRLPLELLNQVMGLSPSNMQWLELAQALPPSYGATMFMHMVYTTMQKRYQLPSINFQRITTCESILASLPMKELRQWASGMGIAETFDILCASHFSCNIDIPDYVAGPTHMHLTAQLDSLAPGDNKREALGPRTSLLALSRNDELPHRHDPPLSLNEPLHTRLSPIALAGKRIVRAGLRWLRLRRGERPTRATSTLATFTRQAINSWTSSEERAARDSRTGRTGVVAALLGPRPGHCADPCRRRVWPRDDDEPPDLVDDSDFSESEVEYGDDAPSLPPLAGSSRRGARREKPWAADSEAAGASITSSILNPAPSILNPASPILNPATDHDSADMHAANETADAIAAAASTSSPISTSTSGLGLTADSPATDADALAGRSSQQGAGCSCCYGDRQAATLPTAPKDMIGNDTSEPEPARHTYAPARRRKANFSEDERRKLVALISNHTSQLATLAPVSARDSCKDVSADHSTSCYLTDAAMLGPDGKQLRILDNLILDLGAFRGVITISELQKLINASAPGSVCYTPYDRPEKLSAETVGGDAAECVGQALIDIYISGRLFNINLLVLRHGNIFLLGNDFSNARCRSVNFDQGTATLRHCADGKACTTFTTSISTINDPLALHTVKTWAAVAKEAEVAPVNGDGERSYFLYAATPKRIDKWSQATVLLNLPSCIPAGASLMLERLHGDAPTRTIARVAEGFVAAKEGYIEATMFNPSLVSSTYVSDMEPIAKITVAPEHLSPDSYADMSLEDLMDSLTFGDTLSQEEVDRWRPMLAAHLHAFSGKRIGRMHGAECRIPTPLVDEGKVAPPYAPPRKLSPDQYAAAWAEFKKLDEQGLLTPTSGTGFGTPIVMVKKPKPDDKGQTQWRMALDLRNLNNVSVKDSYPLPNPVEALNAMGRANWFSALDQSSAFHQIPLAEKDKPKTTVSFPWGQYYYETMPFGLVGASSIFQRAVDAILSGIAWHPGSQHRHFVLAYIDDITVYTEGTLDDHIRDVNEVLGRLGGSGVIMKPSKCFFGMREVEFLGHVVSGEGTKMQKKKVDALADVLPGGEPVSAADLKKLVQVAQYYSRLIDGFSHLSHGIHTALAHHAKKGADLESLKVRASVAAIKAALKSNQVLMRPDMDKPFRLEVDTAVSSGVGAVLSQQTDSGEYRPVAFYSRAFAHGGEERRWSVTQAECSGVVEAVEHFRHYLLPNRHTTELITDHSSLQYLLTAKQLSDVLTRYAMRLSEFDIKLTHHPGKTFIVPDALSRLVKPTGPAPTAPPRGKPRSTVWETLRSPQSCEVACLVLLDAAGERMVVSLADDGSYALPSTVVKPKEQLTATTSRIYDSLRYTTGIRLDPRAPLEQLYIGRYVFIFKRIAPVEWQPKSDTNSKLLTADDCIALTSASEPLGVFLRAWQCALDNGERPLPFRPAKTTASKQVQQAVAALATARKPLPVQREVSLVVMAGDHVVMQVNPRPYAGPKEKKLGSAYMFPRESFSLPLTGTVDKEEELFYGKLIMGNMALQQALLKLWHRVLPDDALSQDVLDPEGDQISWSWGCSGTQYVIVRLAERLLPPISVATSLSVMPLSFFDGEAYFAPNRMFDRVIIDILKSTALTTPSSRLDALLNCRTSAGLRPMEFGEEDSRTAEMAEGLHPNITLVRTAAVARNALYTIDSYLSSVYGDRRVMALDIEGALRVHGWVGLIQVCVDSHVYIFDTIYAAAVQALVATPDSWGAPPLATHFGDRSIVKVVHSGGGDATALYSIYGICLRNVFDSCIADTLLRGARVSRGLGVVLEEWLGVHRPEKKTFEHTDTIWRERPLAWASLQYAAADVSHCVNLYHSMLDYARLFEIDICIQYHSLRLPSSANTPVLVLPMQGDKLLIEEKDGKWHLWRTNALDTQPRQPLPLDVQRAAMDLWQSKTGGPPSPKHDFIMCKHLGRAQRVGPLQVLSPPIIIDNEDALPSGLRFIDTNVTKTYLKDMGFAAYEIACIQWCRYLNARDGDGLPALPALVELGLTARGGGPGPHNQQLAAMSTTSTSTSSPRRQGLLGGALGDGDTARLANIRGRKLTANPRGTGLIIREFLCHGRAQDGQAHAYEVTFDDDILHRVKTDLHPDLQVDANVDFPSPSFPAEQWQLLGHPALPKLSGREGVCPTCYYSSSAELCPVCGRNPYARTTRRSSTSNPRSLGNGEGNRSSDAETSPSPPCLTAVSDSAQGVAEAQASPTVASSTEFSSHLSARELAPVIDGPAAAAHALASTAILTTAPSILNPAPPILNPTPTVAQEDAQAATEALASSTRVTDVGFASPTPVSELALTADGPAMAADAATFSPIDRSCVSISISVSDGHCRLQLRAQDFDGIMSASTGAGSLTSASPTTYSSPGGAGVEVASASPAPEWEPPSQTQYSIRNINSPGRAQTEERDSWDDNYLWRKHLDPMPEQHAREQIGLEPRRLSFSAQVSTASCALATSSISTPASDGGVNDAICDTHISPTPPRLSRTGAARLVLSFLRARAIRTKLSQQGAGRQTEESARGLAALQPRADAPVYAAMIMRDDTHALVMRSYALERQPGATRTMAAGLAWPRGRMHSGFKGSIIARQALEVVLGPLERVSAGANDGINQLAYVGRFGDTLYYEAYIHNLSDNVVALYAAWQQRAATPTDATTWTGFELVQLGDLVTRLGRSDDAAAAASVVNVATSAASEPTAPKGETKGNIDASQCLAYLGENATGITHPHPVAQLTGATDALRHLAAWEALGPSFAGLTEHHAAAPLSQQGEGRQPTGVEGVAEVDIGDIVAGTLSSLHAKADALHKALKAAPPLGGNVAATGSTMTETEAALHAAADRAVKASRAAKLEPPSKAPPDDPVLGNDDTTNVARTRVPGWAPEISRAVIAAEQNADEYIDTLKQLAKPTGFVTRDRDGTFELIDELLFRVEKHGAEGKAIRRQVVVPGSLRGAFMRAFHDRSGHLGIKRTTAMLRGRAWWVGLRRDVRAYIRRCPTCALTKLTRIQAGQARSLGDGQHPGDVWTVDILDIDSHLRRRYKEELKTSSDAYDEDKVDKLVNDIYHPHKLLIFIDRYSRWVEAFLLEKDPTSDEVLDIFVNEVVKRHGYPRAVTSDRGSNLMQGSVADYYEACGIQLVTGDSYMHNSAGLVERFNGTLKDILRGFLTDVDEDADVIGLRWWRYLTYALLSYNTSDATATGYSPFFLMYGRDARLPLQNILLPLAEESTKSYSDYVREHLSTLNRAWSEAREAVSAAASTVRQQQNLSRDVSFELKPGDRVLIKKPSYQGLEVPYAGPFRVAKVLGDDRVQLRDLHRIMHDEFHISRLKLYPYVDNDGNAAADREEYIIKDIKDHRKDGKGELEYLVKWDGWNKSYDLWVPETEFNEHALELVAAYWERTTGGDGLTSTSRDDGITKSITEETPVTKAPAFRSHREQHLEAAPTSFMEDTQTAPEAATSRVQEAKSKSKKKKLKKQAKEQAANASSNASAAAPSASPSTSTSTGAPATDKSASASQTSPSSSEPAASPKKKKKQVQATAASTRPSRSRKTTQTTADVDANASAVTAPAAATATSSTSAATMAAGTSSSATGEQSKAAPAPKTQVPSTAASTKPSRSLPKLNYKE